MLSFTGAKGWRVAIAMALALFLMLVLPVGQASAADMVHEVTNVGYKSFTVTWVIDAAETGYVNYGTSASSLDNTAWDKRGQTTEDNTHYVTITDLTADTTYYYEIVSGGVTYNNGSIPHEITTGPDLGLPPMPEIISGKIYTADGITTAEGTIVYASIGTSQVLSALVDGSGNWGMDIAQIRTADHQSYYTYSDGDDISVEVQGAADGIPTQTVTIATAKTGALAIELTPDATADFNTDETVANVDESIQSSDVAKETTPEEAETEPDKEINLWLISGILAGVIVLTVTVWLINKHRY